LLSTDTNYQQTHGILTHQVPTKLGFCIVQGNLIFCQLMLAKDRQVRLGFEIPRMLIHLQSVKLGDC
jgi:hypothetical protein